MKLEFKPQMLGSIRGTRYSYEVTKTYTKQSIFHTEPYKMIICDVVVKFLDGEEPYIQTSDNTYSVISIDDMKEIIKCAERGFVKEDFEELKLKQ